MKKNIVLSISLILLLILYTDCTKDKNIPDEKQYLFDGLPYYLTDTLFNEETYPDEMIFGAYEIKFDSKGYAWILDTFGTLSRYYHATKELIWWDTKEFLGIDDPPHNMKNLFIDSSDRIWCTASNVGKLYMFEGATVKTMTLDDIPRNMCEDSEGEIHFNGKDMGKEYISDGETVIQTDPPFVTDEYHIYGMSSDRQKNIWYNIDFTPSVQDENDYVVKYHDANNYIMIPELQDGCTFELKGINQIVFDSKGNPYIGITPFVGIPGENVYTFDSENNWEVFIEGEEFMFFHSLHVDHDDNIWARQSAYDCPYKILIAKDKNWIGESDYINVIKDRSSIFDICFPDENTVWICTSGGVFEFKK